MYCSTCGVAVAQGLTFCNYCGARLATREAAATESQPVRPQLLISAMAGLFVLGMPGITFLIFMLDAALHLHAGAITAFAWFSLLLLTALEGIFAVLLFRRTSRKEEARSSEQFKGPVTKELEAMHARGLAEPLASVTEHTTRSFEPVYNEHDSK